MEQSALITTEQANPATARLDKLETTAMLRVINQQDQLVALAVERAIPQIAPVVEAIAASFQQGGRLFYFGAGTSGRLGVLDASEMPPTFGTPADWVQAVIAGGDDALRHPIEGAEDNRDAGTGAVKLASVTANDVVVGLSASGGAPYVLGAVEAAKAAGAKTAGVTCVQGSPLALAADYPIEAVVGPEVLAGSTRMKAGTAQKLILNMLTTGSMVKIGKTYGNLMVDVQPTNAKLKQRAIRLVSDIGQVEAIQAEHLLEKSDWQVKPAIVMARLGVNLPEALQRLERAAGRLSIAID